MTPRRTRIAEGVYRDRWGLAATVKVGRVQRERRFPSDESLDRIKSWQIQTRAELDGEKGDKPAPTRGTFADDVPRYLKQIAGRVSYKSDRSHLAAWIPLVGTMKRTAIKPAHVRVAIATWQSSKKSARTIRHRARVLRELYQTLDGAHAKPPLKGVRLPRPDDPHPTPVPLALIRKVAKSLKAGKRHAKGYGGDSDRCYARFLVRATTGQRPSQIMRATPADVDLKRKVWFVHAGKRGFAIPLPLNAEMIRAWKTFAKAKAWGTFDTRSFSKTIQRHGWPKGTRPYALRHTFAIDLLRGGADLGDVQGLLGHRQIDTTRRFYAPVLLSRLKHASAKRDLKL